MKKRLTRVAKKTLLTRVDKKYNELSSAEEKPHHYNLLRSRGKLWQSKVFINEGKGKADPHKHLGDHVQKLLR